MKLKIFSLFIFATLLVGENTFGSSSITSNNSTWIQPSNENSYRPVWGHKEGLRVGIAPTPGPRGLLRVYAPYLGHKADKMINFIAFEPIVVGDRFRGLSELEMSGLDGVRGKRFWSSNDSLYSIISLETPPAGGIIEKINGVETLTVYIFSEPFENGAQVFVRLRFFEDKPYEIELTTNTSPASKSLDHFILTATMGNYARLRTLYLSDYKKSSLELWPKYKETNFTKHDSTSIDLMIKDKMGGIYFIAATDEVNPSDAKYSSKTSSHWKYYGSKATQYWFQLNPDNRTIGLVNGRYTYWGGKAPIPGGVSFENFELITPFKYGEKFIFGVEPISPDQLIDRIKSNK